MADYHNPYYHDDPFGVATALEMAPGGGFAGPTAYNKEWDCITALNHGSACHLSEDWDRTWVDGATRPAVTSQPRAFLEDQPGTPACYTRVNMIRYDLYNPVIDVHLHNKMGLTCLGLGRAIQALEHFQPALKVMNSGASITTKNYDFQVVHRGTKMLNILEMRNYMEDKVTPTQFKMNGLGAAWDILHTPHPAAVKVRAINTILTNGLPEWRLGAWEEMLMDGQHIWTRNAYMELVLPAHTRASGGDWRASINELVTDFLANPAQTVLCFVGRVVEPDTTKGFWQWDRMATHYLKTEVEGGHRVSVFISKPHQQMFFYDPLRLDWYQYIPTERQLDGYARTLQVALNIVADAFKMVLTEIPALRTFTFMDYRPADKFHDYYREQSDELNGSYVTMDDTGWVNHIGRQIVGDGIPEENRPLRSEALKELTESGKQAMLADWFGGYCGLYNLFMADLLARNPTCGPGELIRILKYLGTEFFTPNMPLITPFIRSFAVYIETIMSGEELTVVEHNPVASEVPVRLNLQGDDEDLTVYERPLPVDQNLARQAFAEYDMSVVFSGKPSPKRPWSGLLNPDDPVYSSIFHMTVYTYNPLQKSWYTLQVIRPVYTFALLAFSDHNRAFATQFEGEQKANASVDTLGVPKPNIEKIRLFMATKPAPPGKGGKSSGKAPRKGRGTPRNNPLQKPNALPYAYLNTGVSSSRTGRKGPKGKSSDHTLLTLPTV